MNFEASTFALEIKARELLHGALRIHSEKLEFFGVAIAEKACSPKVLGKICNSIFKNRQNHRRHSFVRLLHSEKLVFFGVDGDCAFIAPLRKAKIHFFASPLERGIG